MSSKFQLVEVMNRGDHRDFLDVPWTIYRDDRNWIPHLRQDIAKVFDRKRNRAFLHGEAARWVLRHADGRLAGRVAAFVDKRAARKFKQPTGGMGFFECIDDKDAAFTLFDACRTWLEERGMEAMDGPVNFGERIAFWGLLVENFTDPPTYQLGYNPPYYRGLFEEYGFEVYYYQYVYHRVLWDPAQEVFLRKSDELRKDPRFKVRSIRGMGDEKVARDFLEVFNDAWAHRDGVKPLTFERAHKIVKVLKPVGDPDVSCFAYYDDRVVGFWVNIPELNQIFRYVNGNLNLWGKLKFLYHRWKRTPRTLTGVVFGVVKDFHGRGVEGAMIKWGEGAIWPLNRYDDTILTWIGDFNPKMIKVCENLGATRYRTLATFRKLFDENAPFERAPIEG